MSDPTNDPIIDLLVAWEESGQTLSAEAVCRACPELLPRFKAIVESTSRCVPSFMAKSGTPTLKNFEIFRLLGSGGMGDVWRGRDRHSGREVAIKLLPLRSFLSYGARRRFLTEIKALAALEHDCIAADCGMPRSLVPSHDTEPGPAFTGLA